MQNQPLPQDSDLLTLAAERLRDPGIKGSKYDYVKIKVWVGSELEHYYILSRFLIARTLTVTKVPQEKAVKIALEVKKWLVDNDTLDLTQDELEAVLFDSMRARGFGEDYIQRYRMMNAFQQAKRPLIILLCGSACTGKSALAQQLASRLNLPNVLQTDALRELLQGAPLGAPLSEVPLWARQDLSTTTDLISKYQEESRVVRRAIDGDLVKCISDGKSIIIEGLHLDPGLYISEFGRGGVLEQAAEAAATRALEHLHISSSIVDDTSANGSGDTTHDGMQGDGAVGPAKFRSSEAVHDAARGDDETTATATTTAIDNGNGGNTTTSRRCGRVPSRNESIDAGLLTYGGPVFVPIVLRLDPEEYPLAAERWLAAQMPSPDGGDAHRHALQQLLALQDYLSSYEASGVPVMPTGVLNSNDTLNTLHEYVLSCIDGALPV